jgi:hypothetical protein
MPSFVHHAQQAMSCQLWRGRGLPSRSRYRLMWCLGKCPDRTLPACTLPACTLPACTLPACTLLRRRRPCVSVPTHLMSRQLPVALQPEPIYIICTHCLLALPLIVGALWVMYAGPSHRVPPPSHHRTITPSHQAGGPGVRRCQLRGRPQRCGGALAGCLTPSLLPPPPLLSPWLAGWLAVHAWRRRRQGCVGWCDGCGDAITMQSRCGS